MTVYATIDGAGRATGFYPAVLFPTPPEGTIEIGEALHAAWIAAPDKVLVAGALVDPPALPSLTGDALVALKAALCAAIDGEAERQRLRFITGGAGQAMTYARKLDEAKAATIDPSPTAEAYPLLGASVGIDGEDIAAVAAVVIAMDAAWTTIGAAIESARLTAKKAVKDAPDEAGARAAAAVEWPA